MSVSHPCPYFDFLCMSLAALLFCNACAHAQVFLVDFESGGVMIEFIHIWNDQKNYLTLQGTNG